MGSKSSTHTFYAQVVKTAPDYFSIDLHKKFFEILEK